MDQDQEETRQEEEEEESSDEEDCEHSSKDSTRLQLPLEQAEEPEDSHTGHSDNGEYIHKIIDNSNTSDSDNDNDKVVDRVVLGDYVEDVVIKEEDVDAPGDGYKEDAVVPEEPRRVSWTGRAVVACLLLGWGVFLTYCYLTLSPTCTPVTLHCPDPTITFTAQVGYLHIYTISIISTLHRAAAPRCGCTWGRGWGSATSAVWTWRRWWRPAPSTTATPTPPPAR